MVSLVSLFIEGAALPWVPSGPITLTISGVGQGSGLVSGHGPQSVGGHIWDSGFGSQTLAPAFVGLMGHALPLKSPPRVLHANASELDISRWECSHDPKTRTTGIQHLI